MNDLDPTLCDDAQPSIHGPLYILQPNDDPIPYVERHIYIVLLITHMKVLHIDIVSLMNYPNHLSPCQPLRSSKPVLTNKRPYYQH